MSPIKIWDLANGAQRAVIYSGRMTPEHVAVTPDGNFIVRAQDETIRIFFLHTGEERAVIDAHSRVINSIGISPDGTRIASASDDGTVKIWDMTAALAEPRHASTSTRRIDSVRRCAFSADGSSVIVARSDVCNVNAAGAEEEVTVLAEPSGVHGVNALASSRSGALVAWARGDTLTIWNADRESTESVAFDERRLPAIAVSPDDLWLVLGTAAAQPEIAAQAAYTTIDLVDSDRRELVHTLDGYQNWLSHLEIAPNGESILSSGGDGTLKIWDLATARDQSTVNAHADRVNSCAMSPDATFLVSASSDRTVKIWNLALELVTTLKGHRASVTACAVSPDAQYLVSVSEDRTLRLWDLGSRAESRGAALPAALQSVALHPYSPVVACGDDTGTLTLFDLVGVEYGPIVLTAIDSGERASIRCPACCHAHPLDADWLGAVIDCPNDECGLRLRINPFVFTSIDLGPR